MKYSRLTLVSVLLGALVGALSASDFKVFPSYSLASKDAGGEWRKVIGVKGDFPLIVANDGMKVAKQKWVKVNKVPAINDQYIEILSVKETWEGNRVSLELVVKSSEPLSEPFAAIIYKPEDKGWLHCKYKNIPDLTGEAQTINLRFGGKDIPKDGWKLHFFRAGMELYDKSRSDLKEATPQQAFILEMTRRIAATGNGDANPAPFYMPMSKPSDDLLPAGIDPVTVKVKMKISSNGTIADPIFMTDISPELQTHLTATIDQWRFFPRIKQGKIVEQTIVLPLKLR